MYGCPTTELYESHISVRKSGCTDEQLMQQLIENVYLPLFPNCQKETVRNDTGKFMAGPVVFKTDSGQGRLVATFSSLEFRERMQERGVLLVLGLPNSTSCTQEQDQLYQEFKGKTRAMTNEVYSDKLATRSDHIKNIKEDLRGLGFREEYDQDDNNIVTPAMKVVLNRLKDAMKTVSLTNDDLSLIVNGKPNDRLNSPFFSTFTKEKITNCFARVGYVPFTRACLKSEYIRHELGKDTEDTTLQDLV